MSDRDGQSTQQRFQALANVYRQGLLEDVIPFWQRFGVDSQYGGFLTCLDQDGTLVDSDKGIWQQGRATWLFAKLYNTVEPRTEWIDLARSGIEFLDRYATDPSDGRMWFHVTREGRPIRKRRYAFSESFAAMAYAEYARASGIERYAAKAEALFDRFMQHNLDPTNAPIKFTSTRPTRSLGFPMITINVAQELREAIGLEFANQWIDQSIATIEKYHIKQEIECVMETVGSDGELLDHFDGRTLNPGHAIEGAWFIMREGDYRQDERLIQLGCHMLDWMWQRGWDSEFGGIRYFTSVDDRPIQEYWQQMKFWWPQNETIIATLMAWLLSGDSKYATWHEQIHDWAHQRFHDPKHGEWFGYLHQDGRISSTLKGNLWKGPFHLPRMQLICWNLLSARIPVRESIGK